MIIQIRTLMSLIQWGMSLLICSFLLMFLLTWVTHGNECSSSFYAKTFWPSTHLALEKDLAKEFWTWAKAIFFSPEHLTNAVRQLNTFCCSSSAWVGLEENICSDVDPDPVKASAYLFDHLMSVYQYMLEYNHNLVSKNGEDTNLCKKKFWKNGCTPYLYSTNELPSPAVCYRCGTTCDTNCESTFWVGSWVDVLASANEIKFWSQYAWMYEKFRWGEENIIIPKRDTLIWASTQKIAWLSLWQIWFHMCTEIRLIYNQISSRKPLWDNSFNGDWFGYEEKCRRTVTNLQMQHSEYIKSLSVYWSTDSQKINNEIISTHSYTMFEDLANVLFDLESKLLSIWKGWEKFTPMCNAA